MRIAIFDQDCHKNLHENDRQDRDQKTDQDLDQNCTFEIFDQN